MYVTVNKLYIHIGFIISLDVMVDGFAYHKFRATGGHILCVGLHDAPFQYVEIDEIPC